MSSEEYARIATREPSMGTRRGAVRDGWVTVDVQTGSSPRSMAVKVPDTMDEAIALSRVIRSD